MIGLMIQLLSFNFWSLLRWRSFVLPDLTRYLFTSPQLQLDHLGGVWRCILTSNSGLQFMCVQWYLLVFSYYVSRTSLPGSGLITSRHTKTGGPPVCESGQWASSPSGPAGCQSGQWASSPSGPPWSESGQWASSPTSPAGCQSGQGAVTDN